MSSHSVEILELLENGAIDVQEAVRLLKAKFNLNFERKISKKFEPEDSTFVLRSCLGNQNPNLWI